MAQDYKYGKFYRLLNKENLLCLKNKANHNPLDEQSQGVKIVTVLSAVSPKLPAFTTSPMNVQQWGNFQVSVNCVVCKCLGGLNVSGNGELCLLVTSFLYFSHEVCVILSRLED